MTYFHWLGREAEQYHAELPEGMLRVLPDNVPCPTQDELG